MLSVGVLKKFRAKLRANENILKSLPFSLSAEEKNWSKYKQLHFHRLLVAAD